MDHPRLLTGFNSPNPLSPIPPMKKSPFDFSSSAITFMQSPKSSSLPASTADILSVSPPISPIKHESRCVKQSDASNESNHVNLDPFNAKIDALCFEDNHDDVFNKTNINNHRLSVSTMLEDLGLKQYDTLMKEMDLITFLTLTDDDLKVLGVANPDHREKFQNAIKLFCEV